MSDACKPSERTLHTRPATAGDFEFAWRVYRDAVRPMIEPKLDAPWDDKREQENFRSIWVPENAHVVMLDSSPIGWGAMTTGSDSITIDHFYLLEPHRGKGYGTKILEAVIADAKRTGKDVRADALKEGRVLSLVPRLGFVEVAENDLVKSFLHKT